MHRANLLLSALLISCAPVAETSENRTPSSTQAETSLSIDYGDIDRLLVGVSASDHDVIINLVDGLIEKALPGDDIKLDDRSRLLLLNWFVHSNFRSVRLDPFTIKQSLSEQMALCGGSAIAFQLMARRLGFETRTAGLFAIAPQASHVVTEVKFGGRWHFFDPTFGVFITSDGTPNGEIISFDTMIKYHAVVAANAFYAISEGRLGKDHPPRSTNVPSELYSPTQTVMLSQGNYQRFLAAFQGATVYASEQAKTLTSKYLVDLESSPVVEIGKRNGEYWDVANHRDVDDHPDAAGIYFLGDMSGTHGLFWSTQLYRIVGIEPGSRITLQADLVKGDGATLGSKVRKADVLLEEHTPTSYRIVMRAIRSDLELTLDAEPETTLFFDRFSFERE